MGFIDRYDITIEHDDWDSTFLGVGIDLYGDWVKYEDHAEQIAKLTRVLKNQRRRIRNMTERNDKLIQSLKEHA